MKRQGEQLHHQDRGGSMRRARRDQRNSGQHDAVPSNRFRVPHPKDRAYESKRVTLSQPREIAYFSKYSDDRVQFDRSNLMRFRQPSIGADLLEGIEHHVPKDESDPSVPPAPIRPLLDAIDHFRERLSRPPQFITFRNNLNKILGTPYNTSNPWTLCAEKRDGCVYLDVRRSPDELERNSRPMPINQANAVYSGRRFELYATDRPRSDGSDRVNQDNEFCGLFAVTLGDQRLVVAAEIDCYDDRDEESGRYAYVELKTTRVLHTDKDRYVFERFKLLSFWIQSYIVGTPRIVCGFRDDEFALQKLQTFKTTDIPSFCRKYWDPQVCLGFADSLLQWIYDKTQPGQVYRVAYSPHDHHVEMRAMDSEPSFLPVPDAATSDSAH